MTTQRNLTNDGVVLLNQDMPAASASSSLETTFIISGLARSGTSMIARALRAAHIFIGAALDDAVNEDVEIRDALRSRDHGRLRKIIAARNAERPVWGFKRPNLHREMAPDDMAWFRNPRVILSFRDPVAIARRNMVAEFVPDREALQAAVTSAGELGAFAAALACPVLAVSYEKALADPDAFVTAVMRFAGIAPDETIRSEMIAGVDPAPKIYETKAALYFEGHVDRIDDRQMLNGWCREMNSAAPVKLTLLVDEKPARDFVADLYREDLEKAGIGTGRHAFRVDLQELALPDRANLAIQVHGRTYRLAGSDRTVGALRAPPRN
jgi:hypothetical protein